MNICKGHIYIIFCHINPKIYYVGSTFNQLKHRWNMHKQHYNAKQPISLYKYFDEYGIENFSMKLIKSYNVYREHSKDNKHLRVYEQLWINKFRNSCNIQHSFNPLAKLSKQIYYQKNKEQTYITNKKWREKNKEQIKEYGKIKYEKNKEKIKEKGKNYYEKNKNKIKEKRKEKYTCECGSTICINQKLKHLKTLKHQNFIKNNINNI